MKKERYYPSGKMIFKAVQKAVSHESNINENQMVGVITNQYSQKATQDDYRTSGLGNSQKPLQNDANTYSTSTNNYMRTRRNVQRSRVQNAPYSEIYNMVVMRETF